MGRFFAPGVESLTPGAVGAPGDGLEGHYAAVLNSVPSGGQCTVVVPGLDPLHHIQANCPANATGLVGDAVLVAFDDQKRAWLVTPQTHTTEINGTPVPLTGSWTTPTLLNSWTARTGDAPGYMKDPLGFVHLRGRLTGGGVGTTAFVLPAGFRPGNTDDFYPAAAYNGTTAVAAFADILAASGVVVLFYASGATDVSLGGLTFLAEN